MGEMADFALEAVCAYEVQVDEYVAGNMSLQEAYEAGMVNEAGIESPDLKAGYDRASIGSMEEIDNQLEVEMLKLDVAMLGGSQGGSVQMPNYGGDVQLARQGVVEITTTDGRTILIAQNELDKLATVTTRAGEEVYLDSEATRNLSNELPTCNMCRKPMQTREGRFGKFYFCSCPEQVTVSDKYWQGVRRKK